MGFAEDRFELVKDDVVVFLGGANLLHLQQSAHLEAFLTRQFAAVQPRFRDLTWEADTVFRQGTVVERWREDGHGDLDGLGDLEQQLDRLGATVIVCQFGQLESMAGIEGVAEFATAFEELIERCRGDNRRLVLVSPSPFERPPSDSQEPVGSGRPDAAREGRPPDTRQLVPDLTVHNEALAAYVQAIRTLAEEQGGHFIDLFTEAPANLTHNGMHLHATGLHDVAIQIASQLEVDVSTDEHFELLRDAVREKHRLWYDYWRPANWKLLYGDDARRQFTRGGENYIAFKEEWQRLLPLIEQAELRVWKLAKGEPDPGPQRPAPEVLHGDSAADIQKELAAFTTLNGLRVNLFASEREGLTSPLAVRWDPAGRMYVSVTTTYPHVFPGDLPNDKILMLEDTDHDGRADRSTVFADGLNIPTGMEWGDGGLYVGQNTELLFLKDTDGDGVADFRRVVFGGFGNGDSHQTINSFVWSPDGELFFGHGDGCESRVETPWGVSSLFNAGFYRFRPRRLQLVPFLEGHMGPGNPWGIAFDDWGQILNVDGAGGVNWLTPGLVSTTHVRRLPRIGDPGGYCGIDFLDGRHLPEGVQGDFVVGDYKGNQVKRFSLTDHGAGFHLEWKEPVLRSTHRNFRPVDVKVGPDGAIYVVDWYNPITCHQDDAYRDPARDKAHGRIWRISAATEPVRPPDLSVAPVAELVEALAAPERWTRYHAKRVLTEHEPAAVATALDAWARNLDPKDPRYEHHLYEALAAHATIEVVEPKLLERLLTAREPKARAFATRLVGRWHDRLEHPLELLAPRVVDANPRVRLEAVVACAAIPSAQSIEVAARVLDHPMESWHDYAFRQTVQRLRPWWLPAFEKGQLAFARPSHLAAVLNEAGGRDAVDSLKRLVDSEDLDDSTRASAIRSILAVGTPDELRRYGLDTAQFTRRGRYHASLHAVALEQLLAVSRNREQRPAGDLPGLLRQLIQGPHFAVRARALELAGAWRLVELGDEVMAAAGDASLPLEVRAAAFATLAVLELPGSETRLREFSKPPHDADLRGAAIGALAPLDVPRASDEFVRMLGQGQPEQDAVLSRNVLETLLRQEGATAALVNSIQAAPPGPADAKALLRALFRVGRSDPELVAALNRTLGPASEPPEYTERLVEELAETAAREGDAERGAQLFTALACNSCHKLSGTGGDVGPDLTALGTTLSTERIIEELVWPDRQIKEGYTAVAVVTRNGKIHQGYERPTLEREDRIVLEDQATRQLITIPKDQVEQSRRLPSVMPAGLTSLLTQDQLLDLIQFLSELGEFK